MAEFGAEATSVDMTSDGKLEVRVLDQRGHGSLQLVPVLPDGSLGPMKPLFSQAPEPNVAGGEISPDARLRGRIRPAPGAGAELGAGDRGEAGAVGEIAAETPGPTGLRLTSPQLPQKDPAAEL